MNTPKPYDFKELTHASETQNQVSPDRNVLGSNQAIVGGTPGIGTHSLVSWPDAQPLEAQEKPQEQPAEASAGQAEQAQAQLEWLQCPGCTCSVFKIAHKGMQGNLITPQAFVCVSCAGVISLDHPDSPPPASI
jgi:hypothetical protein